MRLLSRVSFACMALLSACSSDSPAGVGGATGSGGTVAVSVSASSGFAASSSSGPDVELPKTFQVSGVVTDGTAPLAGATVMQGGGEPLMTTGADGAFTVELTTDIPGETTLVAGKVGYRTSGIELFEVPVEPLELELLFVSPPDNPSYQYGEPGVGDPDVDNSTAVCGHCHTTFVKQFQQSAHAKSARDPLVQDLYAGVAGGLDEAACQVAGGAWRAGLEPGTADVVIDKCYLGAGVLPDLNPSCGGGSGPSCDDPMLPAAEKPTAFGRCADCHAPAINGAAGGRNLHDAVGNAFENGNHCDFCHHVRDVDLTKPPGNAGRLVVQRPNDHLTSDPTSKLVQVMFGPLLDVPNGFMGGSYQPKFRSAELCAGCHEQLQEALLPGASLDAARWPDGLPTHSTFTEWLDSPFSAAAMVCQECHMPPDETGLASTLDATDAENAGITFGFLRKPSQIRNHIFRGPLEGSPRLIDGAVALTVAPVVDEGNVVVTVIVENFLAGHAVPTGEPMRALVLVVQASGCGEAMVPVGGMTIPDVGGASAAGVVGATATFAGQDVTWPGGAPLAKVGDVVRVVRPTGTFDDYTGVGYFASAALTPPEKGLEVRTPVGEATVLAVNGATLTLDAVIAAQSGDLVWLGDALPQPPTDGEASRSLAGSAGYAFARVLVDPSGARGVPHHRAVDIASDNRLAPQVQHATTHTFAVPSGCADGQVSASLLYRPVPVGLAKERGWNASDHVIATASEAVTFP